MISKVKINFEEVLITRVGNQLMAKNFTVENTFDGMLKLIELLNDKVDGFFQVSYFANNQAYNYANEPLLAYPKHNVIKQAFHKLNAYDTTFC